MAIHSKGVGPRYHSPTIDDRNKAELIEELKRMAPFYTPEWRFRPEEDPDPGTALALLFAHLLEGNIHRLNQVPYKSLLTFLNRFHVELAEARPALAQVTFQLTEGTPEPVFVDKGTQLAAAVPGEPEPVLFETAQPILLTTARLTDMLSISPKLDRIVRIASATSMSELAGEGRGTALFGMEGDNLQEHAMYIQHDDLLLLHHPAYLEFTLFNSQNEHALLETTALLSDPDRVQWEYASSGEWLAFDRVYGHGAHIRLVKLKKRSIDRQTYNGIEGHWIRCRAISLEERAGETSLAKVQFDRILMKSEYAAARDEDGIVPDRLYYNDIQVDAEEEEGCQPFGDFFAQFGLFYLATEEALTKKGADITLRFDLSFRQHRLLPDRPPQINWKPIMKRHEIDKTDIPDPVTIENVLWEYWNGSAWVKLPVDASAQTMFSVPWEGTETRTITFRCPEDLQQIFVNGEANYWIRGRIAKINNAYSPNAIYYSPVMQAMRIRFGYPRPVLAPQRLFILNHLNLQERSNEVRTGGVAIRPFTVLEGRYPSVWFGFDSPPERGPINLYLTLKQRKVTASDVPLMEWEYLRQTGGEAVWSPLTAFDDTNGLTRSGDVRFIGPQDYALTEHYGIRRCWIRAVNRDGRYDREGESTNVPRLLHIALNTTLAVQQKTIRGELPQRVEVYDTGDDHSGEYYTLAEAPVLAEEVWVDETDTLSKEELKRLQAGGAEVEVIRDSEDDVMRVWVRYEAVEQFLRSGPDDRHYVIDRAAGRLSFGNGLAGRRPVRSGEDAVRVTYQAGGGVRGNVPAGTLTMLQDSIAFVDSVSNSFPAAGGCDAGTVDEAVVRGPKLFQHRNRAVTAEDYEWLTRGSHPNVAKVRCLPNLNVKLEKDPGALTIVVLPKSGIGSGAHFQELKRTIEAKLLAKSVSVLAFPGSVQVMEPAMLEIGVQATVWVRSMDDAVPVERELLRKLDDYLDPLTGNADGLGWGIGQVVHHSMFYALLKSVGPVIHVPRLALDVCKVENGDRIDWNPARLSEVPHGVVTRGRHRINVEVQK